MRFITIFLFFCINISGFAQFIDELKQERVFKVNDTIFLNTTSINNENFKLLNAKGVEVDTSFYRVDFTKAKLYLKPNKVTTDSIKVFFTKYPDFLTKTYFTLSDSLIVPENTALKKYYKLSETKKTVTVFDGLNSSGSISRGLSIGNNQNAVVNSQLDLQLSGKLAENITLQASLQDANIPIQEGGYSQNLDEFDQIFIALSGKNWKIRAGDIQATEDKSAFTSFTKKLQGLSAQATITGDKVKSTVYASGALVRGVFNSSTITGLEGNQGPYKLIGENGELYVLIISGSERVYVNGLLLERGQNKDYVIDYNAGEITFNTTYPITSEMRIVVEYQTSQQNYARVFGLTGANISSEKWNINTFFYAENDLKNQSLLQDLSNDQKTVLAEAGDDETQMISNAATETTYAEDQVLYVNIGTESAPIYEQYSGDGTTTETLYQVQFTEVGTGLGNYTLVNEAVVNQVYQYTAPVSGVLQGSYEPISQLSAPIKLQIGVVQGDYSPSENTKINFELAASKNDENLFSTIDDEDNDGGALRLQANQKIDNVNNLDSTLDVFFGVDFIHRNFTSVERSYNVEFDRDWNLDDINANQLLTNVGLKWQLKNNIQTQYMFQHLDFEDLYAGDRHSFEGNVKLKKWLFNTGLSALISDGDIESATFYRGNTSLVFNSDKNWSGVKWDFESNEELDVETDELSEESQRFNTYEIYAGRGDSTKVYVKAGFRHRVTDSILNAKLQRVTNANTWFVNSTVVNKPNASLQLYANYRVLDDVRETEKDKSLNTRLQYRQNFWNNTLQLNTLFETQNGSFAQQDFTYVQVDPGDGVYTWIDYNGDGVQDFDEFEVSVFEDQAEYVRVLLANETYLSTNQNKLSQQVSWNFSSLSSSKSIFKKWLSHFYNQTSYLLDRSVLKDSGALNFTLFESTAEEVGLSLSIRNSLFFNRGKQRYSLTYNFLDSETKSVIVTGLQSSTSRSHEILFAHKIKESWLITGNFLNSTNTTFVENSSSQNYTIAASEFQPKISYLFGEKHSVFLEYVYADKENTQTEAESLLQQKLGFGLRFSGGEKGTVTTSFDWLENDFEGDEFSSVGYRLLEGLHSGTNFVWNVFTQKKLTKFLELNIDYSGRKSENIKAVHTGSVQLRAFF